ncbi:MAG: hypothetical protein K0U52_08190 [Gammaproteobacteria bacterium]|nr:hypothetical protein [Gammaproteobacteria bacterium]
MDREHIQHVQPNETAIFVHCLSNINTQHQTFTITFDLISTHLNDVQFDNITELKPVKPLITQVVDNRDGTKSTVVKQRYIGTFFEHFELEDFPFDIQPLHIKLSSTSDKPIVQHGAIRSELSDPQLPEWQIQPTIQCNPPNRRPTHHQPNNSLVFCIIAHRYPWSYVIKDGLPLFILQSLVWVTYFVPPEDLTERMEITLALLGATIAFNYVLSGHVPRTGYLNIFDKYVLGAFVLIAAMAYEQVATAYLHDHIADKLIMRVIGCIWLLIHMYIVYWIKTLH